MKLLLLWISLRLIVFIIDLSLVSKGTFCFKRENVLQSTTDT